MESTNSSYWAKNILVFCAVLVLLLGASIWFLRYYERVFYSSSRSTRNTIIKMLDDIRAVRYAMREYQQDNRGQPENWLGNFLTEKDIAPFEAYMSKKDFRNAKKVLQADPFSHKDLPLQFIRGANFIIIRSVGPDQSRETSFDKLLHSDFLSEPLNTIDAGTVIAPYQYDPTNGSISKGDILIFEDF